MKGIIPILILVFLAVVSITTTYVFVNKVISSKKGDIHTTFEEVIERFDLNYLMIQQKLHLKYHIAIFLIINGIILQ